LNAYIGNSPLHDGRATFRLGSGWDALNAEAPLAGVSDPAAQDRYYLKKTWQEIEDYPGRFVKLLATKSLWLLQAEEPRDSHSYYFFAEQSPVLCWLPRWILLFPLACVGVVAAWRAKESIDQHLRGMLCFYAIGAALSVVLLVVGFRYRMPLVPALAIAAGVGIDAIAHAMSARSTRQLTVWAVTIAAAVAVSHAMSDPRNLNLAEEWALTGSALITERDLPDAESAYRRALAWDPQSGLAWDGLGLTLYNGGRLAEARTAFERALAIDRHSSRAIYHMALLDDRQGRVSQAADGYERARALSPFDVEVTRDLARARRRLATELGMSGRTREARDAMERVVELTPDNADDWLDLCLLSLDLHDRERAVAALQQARRLGADPGRVDFTEKALMRER
jgi:tetratricopeptide (TPR) repeat protein